jgi:cell division protein FtsB
MQSHRFDLSVTLMCLSLLGYFAWHGNYGPRGFGYQAQLESQAALLTGEFDNVQRQRIRLERKVALLRPESLDPDMLDEMARSQLEVAAPNELVTFQKP